MDAGSGRALQGRYLAPGPVAWRNKAEGTTKWQFSVPGAGIVKGVAKNALYTFTGIDASEKR